MLMQSSNAVTLIPCVLDSFKYSTLKGLSSCMHESPNLLARKSPWRTGGSRGASHLFAVAKGIPKKRRTVGNTSIPTTRPCWVWMVNPASRCACAWRANREKKMEMNFMFPSPYYTRQSVLYKSYCCGLLHSHNPMLIVISIEPHDGKDEDFLRTERQSGLICLNTTGGSHEKFNSFSDVSSSFLVLFPDSGPRNM